MLQAENITTITKAAGVEVEPYWPGLFAKLAEKKSIDEFIVNVGSGKRTQQHWRRQRRRRQPGQPAQFGSVNCFACRQQQFM